MIPEIFIKMMVTLKWQKNIANPSVKLEDVKKEPLNNLEAGIDPPKGSVQLDSLN